MRYSISILILVAGFIVSCKKKNVEEPDVPNHLKSGILVLNEGLFNQNNSTLGWYNLSDDTYSTNFFEQKTNRSLGDTGNDMKRYGGKIYVIVNVSSTVEILDAFSGASLKQIQMVSNGVSKQPRYITFHGSKAYISCYDGFVDVLDTTSLAILQRIPVGANPEELTVSNGKLFVANSGGLNFPQVDSTVSIINLSTNQEVSRITVGQNPGSIQTDSDGDVYVVSRGNSTNIPSRMHRINANTNTLEETFSFNASSIASFNNQFLITSFSGGQASVFLFNTQNETVVNSNFLAMSLVEKINGIYYDPNTNKIYVFDAKNYTVTGKIHVFSSNGSFEKSYSVGLNPCKIIIYE